MVASAGGPALTLEGRCGFTLFVAIRVVLFGSLSWGGPTASRWTLHANLGYALRWMRQTECRVRLNASDTSSLWAVAKVEWAWDSSATQYLMCVFGCHVTFALGCILPNRRCGKVDRDRQPRLCVGRNGSKGLYGQSVLSRVLLW